MFIVVETIDSKESVLCVPSALWPTVNVSLIASAQITSGTNSTIAPAAWSWSVVFARPLVSPVTVDPETPVKDMYSVLVGVSTPFASTLSITKIPGIDEDACNLLVTLAVKVIVVVTPVRSAFCSVNCTPFSSGTLYKFAIRK